MSDVAKQWREYRDTECGHRLADAMAAEVDQTPIDEAWLSSCGGAEIIPKNWQFGVWQIYREDSGRWGLWITTSVFLKYVENRGHLRTLARALSIPLTET